MNLTGGGDRVVPEQAVLFRLTDDGDPAGDFAMTGDYSVTPSDFFLTVPTGQEWYLSLAEFYVQGSGNITANGYGPITSLATGVVLQVRNPAGGVVVQAPPIQTTGDFRALPGTSLEVLEAGPGDNFMVVDWSFLRARDLPLVLPAGYTISAQVFDDLTSLTRHFITISGYSLPRS